MTSLLALTASRPTRTLADDEVLLVQGEGGGDLFILLSGKLVGEMSVLLGIRNNATVRAGRETKVRVIRDANKLLESESGLARRIAAMVAGRLDKQNKGKASEQGLLSRILATVYTPAPGEAER